MPTALDITAQYATAMAAGDTDAMQALWSDEFVMDWVHGDAFENDLQNRAQMTQFWPAWMAAFPENDYEVTRTIAAEKVVVAQWTFTGTQSRPLGAPVFNPALAASGRTICLRGVSVYDIEDGMIQRETIYLDLATLYVELGVTLE